MAGVGFSGWQPFSTPGQNSGPGFRYLPDNERAADRRQESDLLGRQLQARLQEVNAQEAGANTRSNTQADTQRYLGGLSAQNEANKLAFAQNRFNTVFPMVGALLDNLSNERVGGVNTPQPQVSTSGVYTPEMIDQQVNAAKASIAQSAASQQQQAAAKLAGQGFGGRSPLLAALQQQIQGQAMASSADQERQIRQGAAESNAKQTLAGQTLAEQQWADLQDADIRRRQAASQQISSLLSALAQFA